MQCFLWPFVAVQIALNAYGCPEMWCLWANEKVYMCIGVCTHVGVHTFTVTLSQMTIDKHAPSHTCAHARMHACMHIHTFIVQTPPNTLPLPAYHITSVDVTKYTML